MPARFVFCHFPFRLWRTWLFLSIEIVFIDQHLSFILSLDLFGGAPRCANQIGKQYKKKTNVQSAVIYSSEMNSNWNDELVWLYYMRTRFEPSNSPKARIAPSAITATRATLPQPHACSLLLRWYAYCVWCVLSIPRFRVCAVNVLRMRVRRVVVNS